LHQVIIVQTGFEALAFDSEPASFLLFEQIEGDSVEQREVLCGIAGAIAIQVFSEADIERPMQLVFDALVLADGPV
jgi:hypothetical protein